MIVIVKDKNDNEIMDMVTMVSNDTVQPLNHTTMEKIIEKLKLSNYVDCLIIDIEMLEDDEKSILEGLKVLTSLINTNLIILARDRQKGDKLLSDMVQNRIYNILINPNPKVLRQDLEKCIKGEGLSFVDSQEYLILEPENKKTNIQNEVRRGLVSVAVAGTQNRIGTTTQAIAIVNYLNSINKHACYVEYNKNQALDYISAVRNIKEIKQDCIPFGGIDLYKNTVDIQNLIDQRYEYIVYDFGVIHETELHSFLGKDIKIVVAGLKPYELEGTIQTKDLLGDKEVNYIFNFTSELDKEDAKLIVDSKNLYFSNYTPNAFETITPENKNLYNSFLNRYTQECYVEEKNKKIKLPKFFKRG